MTGQPTRILIVEDEALIAMEIKARLTDLGYVVCGVAARGEDALGKTASAKPDLVLMDTNLAGEMNGIETALRLRGQADVPVVFLTAYSDDDILRRATGAEPFGYLVKPFQERELHATIQMALYKHRMERALREANLRLEDRVRERTAQLRASEARLRYLIGTSPAIIYSCKPDGYYGATYMSPNVSAQLGHAPEAFVSDPAFWRNNIHPDDAPRVLAALPSLFEERSHTHEYRFRHKNGEWRWMRDEVTMVRDAAGAPREIVGAWLDITELRLAREKLQEANENLETLVAKRTDELYRSERRFSGLFEFAPDAIAMVDAEGSITLANRQAEATFGYSRDELVGQPVEMLMPESVRSGYVPLRDRSLLVGTPRSMGSGRSSLTGVRKDGTVFPAEISIGPMGSSEDDQVVAIVRDVTAREATQREIATIRGNLADALESIEHTIALYDKDDRLVLFNQRFADRYRALGDLVKIGTRFEDLVRAAVERGVVVVPPGQETDAFIVERVARHWQGAAEPISLLHSDGRTLHLSEHRARNGGVITVGIDVTEQVKAEHRLRDAQRMEAIGKLTGGMAHDFNNYLGVIIGNLDLVKEHQIADSAVAKLIEEALAGALRGTELTRSLLAFSRRQPLAPRRTDLGHSLEAVATLLKRTLGEDITLTTAFASDFWPVRIDGAQLDSCIVNLANNARDAMPRGGALAISGRNVQLDEVYAKANPDVVPGDYVLIEVSDTGAGMSPETMARAFEPFFSTKPLAHGTGLGLSMVYGFVKQSGGHIKIYSEVGHGTTVRIYLPRDREAEEAPPSSDDRSAAPAGGTETILVVEDNDQMRRTAVAQLASFGYRVIEATNGAAALAILSQREPHLDLLFTDIVMPGKPDGYELARLAFERRPGIRMLLTSGFPGDTLRHNGNHAAQLSLLGKPYRLDDLIRAIRTALDSTPAKLNDPA